MKRKVLILCVMALLLAAGSLVSAQDETFSLTVLHTNDTHSHHEPDSDGNGGVARQATVLNQIRSEVDNVLLLDGGDRFTGTLFHTTYLGQDQVRIMNLLGYDAMALGNHEFDNGDEVLAAFIEGLSFPAVAANIDFSASPILAGMVEPYAVLDVAGEQIGVIGLTTADTVELSSPGDELVFNSDLVAVANQYAAELTEMGVNKIFLLTHTGINTDLAIADQLVGIDVFVGGHSHTLYSNTYVGTTGEYPLVFTSPSDETLLYVQAGQYNTYLGRLNLEFDANGVLTNWDGDTILLSRYITPNAELEAVVNELVGPIEALRTTATGAVSEVFLDGNRSVCRVEECNLGNIIADALRWETGAQIGLMNGGGIRTDLEAGELTYGDILTLHPFGNQVATFDITGAGLLEALENSVSAIALNDSGQVQRSGGSGRFLQVSGLRFSFDPTLEPGSRVVSVEVEQEDGTFAPLDPEAVYSVATNNFTRGGGDGYTVFAEQAINPYDFGRLDYEVTGEYMVSISPITQVVDPENPRITILNAEVEPRSE